MFCCLFITHFLNRLCSNPTPLLFLFLDAKAQTSLFADFIYFFPTSISPDIKDKAHFPRCEIFFPPSFWGVPTDVIKDSVDSVVPRRPLWTSNPPPLLPPTRSCLRTTFPQILNPFVSTSHLLHTALISTARCYSSRNSLRGIHPLTHSTQTFWGRCYLQLWWFYLKKKNLAGLILVPVNGIKTRWAAVTVSPINNGASPEAVWRQFDSIL